MEKGDPPINEILNKAATETYNFFKDKMFEKKEDNSMILSFFQNTILLKFKKKKENSDNSRNSIYEVIKSDTNQTESVEYVIPSKLMNNEYLLTENIYFRFKVNEDEVLDDIKAPLLASNEPPQLLSPMLVSNGPPILLLSMNA